MSEKYFLGVDIGSSYTKACLIDKKCNIIAEQVLDTGIYFEKTGKKILRKITQLAKIDREDIPCVVSTGVGRTNFPFKNSSRTEISCLSKGAFFYFPERSTVIDIGAEDVKVVNIDANGNEVSFRMNRKCAAGTGAFLEEISRRLKMSVKKLNERAEKAKKSVEINSFCTVFAGTEIIHLLREGRNLNELSRGIYNSLVDRVLSMVPIRGDFILAGGVISHNSIVPKIFKEKTGIEPLIPPNPQLLTAFGASLFALKG